MQDDDALDRAGFSTGPYTGGEIEELKRKLERSEFLLESARTLSDQRRVELEKTTAKLAALQAGLTEWGGFAHPNTQTIVALKDALADLKVADCQVGDLIYGVDHGYTERNHEFMNCAMRQGRELNVRLRAKYGIHFDILDKKKEA